LQSAPAGTGLWPFANMAPPPTARAHSGNSRPFTPSHSLGATRAYASAPLYVPARHQALRSAGRRANALAHHDPVQPRRHALRARGAGRMALDALLDDGTLRTRRGGQRDEKQEEGGSHGRQSTPGPIPLLAGYFAMSLSIFSRPTTTFASRS